MYFFFCSYKHARGKKLLSECFFLSSLLLFPFTTCHMLLWQTIDCTEDGKKETRGKLENAETGEKGEALGKTQSENQTEAEKHKDSEMTEGSKTGSRSRGGGGRGVNK